MDKKEVLDFLKNSNYRSVKTARQNLKKKLVDYKGGKCEICGYDKCIDALDFHHLNPNEKDFGISEYGILSFERLKKEVDKCILVCCRCHREIHSKQNEKSEKLMGEKEKEIYAEILNNRELYKGVITNVKNSYKFLIYTDIINDMKQNMSREEIFSKYHINNKTFNNFLKENNLQYSKTKKVKVKPTKEELIELLKTNSKSGIGRIFGVSCGSVIKWCKKYNLQN